MKPIMKVALLLVCCVLMLVQPTLVYSQTAQPYPLTFTTQWQSVTGFLPASATVITNTDSYVDYLHLANITAGSITVTITDASTNCSSGPCQWWPVILIPANTVYVQALGGVYSPKGVTWSASAANSVVGWIRGKYPATVGP